jgi:LPXTG-site transpeptidase (sortase) family protein
MKKWFIAIGIVLLLLVSWRMYRFYDSKMNENARKQLEKAYYEAVLGEGIRAEQQKLDSIEDSKSEVALNGVIGRILIPTLKVDYLILDHTTDKNLDISITKVIGPDVHQKGNLVLAGHNMKNGSFFGKLKSAQKKDVIILENLDGVREKYFMVDKYIVKEDDLSPLSQTNKGEAMVTLITCTEESDERLIVVVKR